MNIFYYLLEVNLYVFVFYCLFKVLFERNTFYQLNRYYLLGSLITAFIIPLVDLRGLFMTAQPVGASEIAAPQVSSIIPFMLLGIYICGVVFMLLRFGLRLRALFSLLKKGVRVQGRGFKLVLVNELDQAFSFMNFIFLNPRLRDSEVILLHEQVHIKQRHSVDLLFLDMVQALSWFNPLITFIRNDLKILHEYIADEEVTSNIDTREYAMFLIENTYGFQPGHLGSYMFNQSNLKKRIMKLSQKRTGTGAQLKYLIAAALVPLMMGAASVSFARNFALISIMPESAAVQDTVKTKKAAAPAQAKSGKPAEKAGAAKPAAGVQTVKFPPPIVKKSKSSKAPKAAQGGKVKFPPPVVAPPPPPVDPSRKGKKGSADEIAPPRPPVPAGKAGKAEELPPPPPEPPRKKN